MKKKTNKFYTFDQNNSGGSFVEDKKKGIGQYVIIEAASYDDALDKAESIGLYWNGVDNERDCSCCGDRWSTSAKESKFPSIYGEDVTKGYKDIWNVGSYIHMADGTIKKVKNK